MRLQRSKRLLLARTSRLCMVPMQLAKLMRRPRVLHPRCELAPRANAPGRRRTVPETARQKFRHRELSFYSCVSFFSYPPWVYLERGCRGAEQGSRIQPVLQVRAVAAHRHHLCAQHDEAGHQILVFYKVRIPFEHAHRSGPEFDYPLAQTVTLRFVCDLEDVPRAHGTCRLLVQA